MPNITFREATIADAGPLARISSAEWGTEQLSSIHLQSGAPPMPIQFRHDVDQVLRDAKAQQKPVLLDFSAAPM
jgi:hypothetical protein